MYHLKLLINSMVVTLTLYINDRKKMSKRVNYDHVSTTYDDKRSASGADAMVALMQLYSGKPIKDIHVLDAGCGTGNYAKALLQFGIKHLTLLDASSGMLETAKTKLAHYITNGTISDVATAAIPPIPFPDSHFDAVMFNVVFNHLDTDGDGNFPNSVETLKEARRVLKPNGVIVISTVLKSTILQSMWITKFHKEIGEKFARNLPSYEQFEHIFKAADIFCRQKIHLLGTDMYKNYYDLQSPDCILYDILHYVNATEEECKATKEKIATLKETGEIQNWARENDNVHVAGHKTVFFCQ